MANQWRIFSIYGSILHHKRMVIVLISADAEWEVVRGCYPQETCYQSPYGEWFYYPSSEFSEEKSPRSVNSKPWILFQGGWGKISAAGSTQYVIDRWQPDLLVNLGTCGGFAGEIDRLQTVLADRTIVYDIYEQMGDPQTHTNFYTTRLDAEWVYKNPPHPVHVGTLVSADRDLFPEQIQILKEKYQASAGDWESGAIAFVANRNQTRLIILRGVTDLVGTEGGEAYQNVSLFKNMTRIVMNTLLNQLPDWVNFVSRKNPSNHCSPDMICSLEE
jgi:adenosylhomocysteine nucleosidase